MGDFQLNTVTAHVKNEALPQEYLQKSWMGDISGLDQLEPVNKIRLSRTKRFQHFLDDENPNAFGIKYDVTDMAGRRLFYARDRRLDPIDKAILDSRDESNRKGMYHIYDKDLRSIVHTVNCESSITVNEDSDQSLGCCFSSVFCCCCAESHDYSDWNDVKVVDETGTIGSVIVDKVHYKSFAAGNEYDLVLSVKSEWGEPILTVVHDSTKRIDDPRSDVWEIFPSHRKADQHPVGSIRFKYEENDNERDFYIKIMCFTITFPEDIDVNLKAVLLCTAIYLDNKVFNRVVWRRAGEIEA